MINAPEMPNMRALAESYMSGAVTITGPSTLANDPATDSMVRTPGPTHYEGKALVQAIGGDAVIEHMAGSEQVTVRPYAVKIPITVTGVQVGDEVTVTTSGDPDLVGKTLIVVDGTAGNGWAIQRRLICSLNLG